MSFVFIILPICMYFKKYRNITRETDYSMSYVLNVTESVNAYIITGDTDSYMSY